MKNLSKFQNNALSAKTLQYIKGGAMAADDCHKSYSSSEVRFLMDANGWSERKAKRVLYLSCKYAVTP